MNILKAGLVVTIGLAGGLSGLFTPSPTLADEALVGNAEKGQSVYGSTCVACHGAKGKGTIPGVPDFTKKKGVLKKTDPELFDNIKNGFQSPGSFMAMPPLGGDPDLTDQDVADVIAYIRKKFGRK